MRAPLSWLRDYATFDQPADELAAALSALGLVVEGVEHVGGELPGVVVARILDIRPHPSADRIRLMDVDAGQGDTLQICCGAWNPQVGDLVPLATVGAVLPDPSFPVITRRKMRGEWSNGMLCSPEEIGLPHLDGVDGLFVLPPGSAEPGTPIAEVIGGGDVVFDLDVSPNRPDALCMAGVARDLAAWFGLAWAWPVGLPAGAEAAPPRPTDQAVARPAVTVEAPDACPLFNATVIEGVTVAPSPWWLASRLVLAGMRPISNVVDASNYVMLDTGQPNHAYDLDRLAGGGLVVRRAHPGEEVVTLDERTRTLGPDDLLICDTASVPVGVAGVMGAAVAEVGPGTTRLLLEAAWFAPNGVAATGARLGLTSEARQRFERGVDPEIGERATDRFVQLLGAVAGPDLRVGPRLEVRAPADLPTPAAPELRLARVNAVLGTDLDADAVTGILTSIGFTPTPVEPAGPGAAGPTWRVQVPSWRPDSDREIDLIEEVARHHGYASIARRVPQSPRSGALTPYQRGRRRVAEVLRGAGLDEAWTTTFLSPEDLAAAGLDGEAVRVANPLEQAASVLRTSLRPGLLRAARFNRDRQQPDVAFFETGRVFSPPTGEAVTPDEREHLGVLLAGADVDARRAVRVWTVLRDAFAVVGTTLVAAERPGLHATRTAVVEAADGTPLGAVGEIDPDVVRAAGLTGRVAWLELSLDAFLHLPTRPARAGTISRFPASDVDLAFLVDDDVAAGRVLGTLAGSGDGLLEDIELWDVYRGQGVAPGRRSLTFRLRYRAPDRTLTDADVAAARQAAIDAATTVHHAELRG